MEENRGVFRLIHHLQEQIMVRYMRILLCVVLLFLLSGCAYESETAPEIRAQRLIINEVVSNNCTGLYDANGKTSNWLELYNSSGETIDLSQYYLSDDREKLLKWQLGERVLLPSTYEVIHLSGESFRDTGMTPETIEIGIQAASGWADSDTASTLPGYSFFEPYAFDSLTNEYVDGSLDVSASLYLGDNVDTIGWKGDVAISMSLNVGNDSTGDKYLNIGDYNQVELKGYFEKGKRYEVDFGLDSWGNGLNEGLLFFSGLQVSFVGTGEENGRYTLQINKSEDDNLVAMNELDFLRISHSHIADTVSFTLRQVFLSSTIGNFHTNFKVSSDGDELYLSTEKGEIIDSLLLPSLRPDVSYGRGETGSWQYFETATPGKRNEAVFTYVDTVEAVAVVKKGGFYQDSIYVSFDRQSDATLYYTTDGSIPTLSSNKYTEPFSVKKTTTVRVAAFRDSALASEIVTETYFIDEKTALPVVAITVDPIEMFDSTTGMYMVGPNAGDSFPYFGGNFWDPDLMVNAHMEFFEESKRRAVSRPFGLKIHGGWSRGEPKKSFALLFKDQYNVGDLAYPIFPEYPDARRFKSLILRTGGGHSKDVMIYDGFNSYLTKGRNIEYQKMRSVKLFINGTYWGLYNIREKLNEHFFTTNFALDGSQVNMVKDAGVIQQGSIAEYVTLMNFIRENDITYDRNYDYVASQMDVDNYIDYMATEIFIVNTDWPANNLKWWKSTLPNSKWRWIIYDTDGVLPDTIKSDGSPDSLRYQFDMMQFCTENESGKTYPNGPDFTFLFRNMLENSKFRKRYVNRTMTMLNTNFTTTAYKQKLFHLLSYIGDEYKRDFDRWGFSYNNWSEKLARMEEFAEERPGFVRKHIQRYFSFSNPVEMTLETERGEILVDGLSTGASITGYYFSDVPLSISLSDTTGFTKWSDGNTETSREVLPSQGASLKALF